MIKVETKRVDYHEVVVVKLDEEGVGGLTAAAIALTSNPSIQFLEIKAEGSMPLRLEFEGKVAREEREKKEAEEEARHEAERMERDREKKGAQPKPPESSAP